MKSLMMVAVLALTVAAQTSKPAEEFQLWKPIEVGKQLDTFIAKNEQMNKDITVVNETLHNAKLIVDHEERLRILLSGKLARDRYVECGQSKETKDGAKKFGVEIDGVFFYYAGAVDLYTDSIGKCTYGAVRYWNSTEKEILGIKLYSLRLTDIFGDESTVNYGEAGSAVPGTEAGAVDTFENTSSVFSEPIRKSMKTARLTAIKAKIVFKPKSK